MNMNIDIHENEKVKNTEKYYWQKADGSLEPVHMLTDLHICNIVMKFGKDKLYEIGHTVIVDRFEELNKKYKFFDIIKEK